MSGKNYYLPLALACAFALTSPNALAASFTFADIDFWVGTGANQAALVIDWGEDAAEPPALAWGYRWNGMATGADMLAAILAADARLFAKLGGAPGSPAVVYGLGYDANDDGQFALDDGTAFDAGGIAITGPADLATSIDANDYYAEGWFTGFWHYGVPVIPESNPYDGGQWRDISSGMAGRDLVDGAWDSWAFTPTFDFAAFAENPQAAASPFAPGDFNRDRTVDDADYQLWKSAFGSTTAPDVDANGDGTVDAADYTVWRDNLGASTITPALDALALPEPTIGASIVVGFAVTFIRALRKPLIRANER
jgi:hypothetical protein